MKRTLCVSSLCVALLVALGACAGDSVGIGDPPPGPTDLIVEGGVGFQVPHGGQPILVVLIAAGLREVARQTGTVSTSTDVAFSFTFRDALVEGLRYEILYWIDSNDGGGSLGACDVNDHQDALAFTAGQGDLFVELDHDDSNFTLVCTRLV